MIDLIGLANALTDVTLEVSDEEVSRIGASKGFHTRKSQINYEEFLRVVESKRKSISQGGAPTNVVYGARLLGLKTALFATLGKDEFGKAYVDYLKKADVRPFVNQVDGESGVCYILVTPDREKSLVASLGVAKDHSYDASLLAEADAKMFFTSGYEMMANPAAVKELLLRAKDKGMLLSIDVADPGVPARIRPEIEEIIDHVEVLFVTEEEAEALTGLEPYEALEELGKRCPVVVLKKGARGSVVRQAGVNFEIPCMPAKLVNTCGAGDAYAAGFLTGYLRKLPVQRCGELGAINAAKVCAREEAHL